jgi:hypothetical protein
MILLKDEVPVKFKLPESVMHVYEGQKHQSRQHCPAFSKSPTLGRRRCVKLCSCGYSVELHLHRRRQPRVSSPVLQLVLFDSNKRLHPTANS